MSPNGQTHFKNLFGTLCIKGLMSNTRKRYKKKQILRRFWIRPAQTSLWSDKFLQDKVISEDWRENLRMSRNSFYKLCDLLAPFTSKNTTYIRQPISPETEVAATLYYLSDAGRMGKTANFFGIGKSTVSSIVKNVTEMKCQHLGPKFIKLPLSENEVKHLTYCFEKFMVFPSV